MPELIPDVPGSLEWTAARLPARRPFEIITDAADPIPPCHLCGNVNPAEVGPITGACLDGRACRRRQAGLEPVNPEPGDDVA